LDRIGIWLYPYSTSREHSQHLAGHHAPIMPGVERAAKSKSDLVAAKRPIRQVAGRSLIKGLQPPVRLRYASRSR
jgi:hypothetical protein